MAVPECCCRFTLSAALSKYASEASAQQVHALYERHRHSTITPLDTHVFNAVLSAHASAGNVEQFESVWSDMHDAHCAPTPASHACHIKLLLAAHGSAAVLQFYRDIVGDPTDAVQRARAAGMVSAHMYTSVFVAAAAGTREGTPVTFAALWMMWRDMIELGVPIDDQLASSFLAAAKGMVLTPREV
jgi:pentatricopeptide repeat protein